MNDEPEEIKEDLKPVVAVNLNTSNDQKVPDMNVERQYNVQTKNPSPEKQKQKRSSIAVEKASYKGPENSGKILVTKWIDYSSKYGIGYQLSNGVYGVLFNDSTKIIVSRDHYHFCYLKRDAVSTLNVSIVLFMSIGRQRE